MSKKFNFIIDGYGLAYKSHFSHLTLTTSTGILTGCLYGFLISLQSLRKKYPHCHFYIVWDTFPKRKKDIFPAYKAFRNSANIKDSLITLKELLSCINISQVEYEGEEADDVMASLATPLSETSQVYIYSNDKDMLQLVKDGKITVIQPGHSGNPEQPFDEEAVIKKYSVTSEDFPCYQAFRGDATDNVPGIPFLRSKTIQKLSSKYKNPKIIYEKLKEENLTEKEQTSILENEKQIYINYELVKLRKDLILNIVDGKPDSQKIENLLTKYEIKSISAEQLIKKFETESGVIKTSPQIESFPLFQQEGDYSL